MSNEPLKMHVHEYDNLTHLTSEGNYVNIVDIEKADTIANQFLSSMDVYPSSELPVIKEFF